MYNKQLNDEPSFIYFPPYLVWKSTNFNSRIKKIIGRQETNAKKEELIFNYFHKKRYFLSYFQYLLLTYLR